jgi:hypothetical protein
MPENLQPEKIEQIREIMKKIDKVISENQYRVEDVLNALSMFSISVAVRMDLNKETYMNDLSIMFDERKSIQAK